MLTKRRLFGFLAGASLAAVAADQASPPMCVVYPDGVVIDPGPNERQLCDSGETMRLIMKKMEAPLVRFRT